MLTEVAGSLLDLGSEQSVVRATSIELTLPIDVKMRHSKEGLIFCADVPAWRWRTYWDPPFGQLQLVLEETEPETET
jgi:hypothetical protein